MQKKKNRFFAKVYTGILFKSFVPRGSSYALQFFSTNVLLFYPRRLLLSTLKLSRYRSHFSCFLPVISQIKMTLIGNNAVFTKRFERGFSASTTLRDFMRNWFSRKECRNFRDQCEDTRINRTRRQQL